MYSRLWGLLALPLALSALCWLGGASASAESAKPTILVLDSSGSMAEPDGSGSTKMASAKNAIRTLTGQLDSAQKVGLRVFGAKVSDKGGTKVAAACRDTQLAQPVATLDSAAVVSAANALKPTGDTPIGLALEKAAADLGSGGGTVVLVSDGEDSCAPEHGPDPCAVARKLSGSGVELAVQTVGLRVNAAARKQLTCIAEATKGTYTDVTDVSKLATTMTTAVNRGQRGGEYGDGEKVAGGADRFSAPEIESGKVYADSIVPEEEAWYRFTLKEGQRAKVRLVVDGRVREPDLYSDISAKFYREDESRYSESMSLEKRFQSIEVATDRIGEEEIFDKPGDWAVAISGSNNKSELPYEIHFDIEDAEAAPSPSPSAEGTPSPSAGEEAETDTGSTAGSDKGQDNGDSGTPTPLLVGGGLGLLLLGAGGGVALSRIGRTPKDGDSGPG